MSKFGWVLLLSAAALALCLLWHILPAEIKAQLGATPMRQSNAEQYVDKEFD